MVSDKLEQSGNIDSTEHEKSSAEKSYTHNIYKEVFDEYQKNISITFFKFLCQKGQAFLIFMGAFILFSLMFVVLGIVRIFTPVCSELYIFVFILMIMSFITLIISTIRFSKYHTPEYQDICATDLIKLEEILRNQGLFTSEKIDLLIKKYEQDIDSMGSSMKTMRALAAGIATSFFPLIIKIFEAISDKAEAEYILENIDHLNISTYETTLQELAFSSNEALIFAYSVLIVLGTIFVLYLVFASTINPYRTKIKNFILDLKDVQVQMIDKN